MYVCSSVKWVQRRKVCLCISPENGLCPKKLAYLYLHIRSIKYFLLIFTDEINRNVYPRIFTFRNFGSTFCVLIVKPCWCTTVPKTVFLKITTTYSEKKLDLKTKYVFYSGQTWMLLLKPRNKCILSGVVLLILGGGGVSDPEFSSSAQLFPIIDTP
jgi:hypothetical protein